MKKLSHKEKLIQNQISKYDWRFVEPYLDSNFLSDTYERNKKNLSLREFKDYCKEGYSAKDILKLDNYDRHLVNFYAKFCQGKIFVSKGDFLKEYNSGKDLREIAKIFDIPYEYIKYFKSVYKIKSKGANFIKRKRTELELTEEQKQIILGSSIGDAGRSKINSVIKFKHSIKQKAFILWKFSKLKNICKQNLLKENTQFDKRHNSYNTTCQFYTKANSFVEKINKNLYYSKSKEVNFEHLNQMKQLALAVFFMDDGTTDWRCHKENKNAKPSILICTDSFSLESCENIVKWLKEKWNIESFVVVRNKEKNHFRIRIKSSHAYAFFDIIRPHIIPSMMYKVDFEHFLKHKGLDIRNVKNIKEEKDLTICPSGDLTDEKLKEEYSINKLTDKEIALKYNIGSKATVWRRRKKLGIENLNKNKSNQNARKNRVFNISLEDALKFNEEKKTYKEISEIVGCSLIVVKRRFKELNCLKNKKSSNCT